MIRCRGDDASTAAPAGADIGSTVSVQRAAATAAHVPGAPAAAFAHPVRQRGAAASRDDGSPERVGPRTRSAASAAVSTGGRVAWLPISPPRAAWLPFAIRMASALLIVDVQRDFLPGGALAVPDGTRVIEPLLALAATASLVVASRDTHPAEHSSFSAQGGSWPEHCVVGSDGAELEPRIAAIADLVVCKGTALDRDAYSAFDGTGLTAMLQARAITTVLIGGLATDYCVRASALDALAAGFEVRVDPATVAAVDVAPGDGLRALGELAAAGAIVGPQLADSRTGCGRPTPRLTADVACLSPAPAGGRQVLLVRRAREPHAGSLALPGGFVEPTESAAQAGARELGEETGLAVDAEALVELGSFSAPGRDPRGWIVSIAFLALLDEPVPPTAGDDAAAADWYPLAGLEPLAFDHDEILARALAYRP